MLRFFMRKGLVTCALCALLALVGCSANSSVSSNSYEIDYGQSDLYTQEDIDSAASVLAAEFEEGGGLEGCALKRIAYTSDYACRDHTLDWCNDVKDDGNPDFDELMVLTCDFQTPSDEGDAENLAFEPDTLYENYYFFLGRTSSGEWQCSVSGWLDWVL